MISSTHHSDNPQSCHSVSFSEKKTIHPCLSIERRRVLLTATIDALRSVKSIIENNDQLEATMSNIKMLVRTTLHPLPTPSSLEQCTTSEEVVPIVAQKIAEYQYEVDLIRTMSVPSLGTVQDRSIEKFFQFACQDNAHQKKE